MREIKAFIRRTKIDDVVHGLKEIGVKAMSILPVEGIGALSDPSASRLSLNYITSYSMMYKIEVVCREADTNRIVGVILKCAQTGAKGDGVIFVSSIERAVKIRSGEEGEFVLHAVDGGKTDADNRTAED